MREAFPERSPPGVKARSPCVRLPIRSPARGSLTRKATTPHLPWSHLPYPLSRLLSSARLRETPTLDLIDEDTSISDDQVSLNFFQTLTASFSSGVTHVSQENLEQDHHRQRGFHLRHRHQVTAAEHTPHITDCQCCLRNEGPADMSEHRRR
jgi:hypothetical protein